MPGPSPDDHDSQSAFMHECVPFYVDEGKPQDQAVAICLSQWREKSYDIETRSLRGRLVAAKRDVSDEPRDNQGQWTSGFGGDGASPGPQAALGGGIVPLAVTPMGAESTVHNIPGIGDVDQYIASHPPEPGERPYEWEGRLVKGMPMEQQNDVLFYTREQYPPVKYLADAMSQYRSDHGLPEPRADITAQQVDLTKANEVGRAFESMPDMSNDPRTQFAYDDFKAQTNEQWHLLTDPPEKGGLGVKVDFVNNDEPYPSAKAQADDLRDNHHLSIATGLGGEHQASMTTEEYDQFRAVHDAFGHASIGGGFDRHGEYQAWLAHESMYTGLGARAMSSEYHGVNSALWSGDPNDPGGTGKTILLPDRLTDPPWDEHGNLVRKGIGDLLHKAASPADGDALQYFIDKLGLDSEWAHQFVTPPWHPCDPSKDPAYKSAKPCCEPCGEKERLKYDENEARDDRGRWTSDGSVDVPSGVDIESMTAPGSNEANPIRTKDVHEAALALRDGKYVELDQPKGVSTLLDEINKMVGEAVKNGEDAKVESAKYDLCRASIPGTNLNCDEAVVESRTGMPQLKGVPLPGSPADSLPKNDKGEVDLAQPFVDHLRGMGIETTSTTVPAENLRASQRELNGGKVAGMANAMIAGTMPPGSIFTTRDDYVLDGHHRWAATVGVEYKQDKSISMPVDQIDMNITDAIREANAFTEKMGIPHAAKGWSQAIAKARGTIPDQSGARSLRHGEPTRGKAMSSTKRGVYEITEFKSAPVDANPTGEFTALVSVFNNVDLQGDRVMPGAFKSWLANAKSSGDPIPVVWSHQWDVPSSHIGVIDPAQMKETPQGLVVKGTLDIHGPDANPVAKQVHKLLMRRSVKGWSFAYDVHNEKRAKDGANELLDLSIIEVGPTLKGANPEAQTVGAKAMAEAMAEIEAKSKAGRTISSTSATTLKQVYDLLEQMEDLTEKAETILEGMLGIPDDDANDEGPGDATKSGTVDGMKADKYSAEELRSMLAAGHAMRNENGDPAYPIEDAEDLGNAIQAVGRGGASANAIRKYVMRRADAMNMTDKIPDTWNNDGSLKATEVEFAKFVDPFEDSTAADGAESKIEEGAEKSALANGREPEAKSIREPDSETLLIRHRIEEMRQH